MVLGVSLPMSLAYIQSLPFELKEDIFRLSCACEHREMTPLALGAVCKDWRNIIWNLPRFWATLNLRLSGSKRSGEIFPIVKQWLERSDGLPLSITLAIVGEITHCHHNVIALFGFIMNQAHRWEHLHFTVPLLFVDTYFSTPIHLPLLRSMYFYSPVPNDEIQDWTPLGYLPYLLTAPLLRKATIHGFVALEDIPYPQLEDLKVKCEILDLFKILGVAQNLRRLEYQFVFVLRWTVVQHYPTGRVTVPQLQSLKITSSRPFEFLDLPALKILYLHGCASTNPSITHVLDLLKYSSCQLEELHIDDSFTSAELNPGIIQCLKLLPSLTTLSFLNGTALNVAKQITRYVCDPTLLPNLNNFRYSGTITHDSLEPFFDSLSRKLRHLHDGCILPKGPGSTSGDWTIELNTSLRSLSVKLRKMLDHLSRGGIVIRIFGRGGRGRLYSSGSRKGSDSWTHF